MSRSSRILSLSLKRLTRNVSKPHQSKAPPKIDRIPHTETKSLVFLPMNSNRAKRAIRTNKTNGFEKVNPKEVKKSPGKLCFTVSFGFGWVDGLLL